MNNRSQQIVQRLWNYCNVLRDDGIPYTDYVEQLTYLIFLKMIDEQVRAGNERLSTPSEYGWQSLRERSGD